jgi:hypothetical protein
MLPYLLTALWIPFSVILHNLIHEGAHGLAAILNGGRILYVWPFPSRRLGYFTWAYVEYAPLSTGGLLLLIAPVIAELVWLASALGLACLTHGGLRKVLLLEVVSSNVDIVVWLLGYWNPTRNEYCDAERFRSLLGFSRPVGKILSLLYLPIAALCVFALTRLL